MMHGILFGEEPLEASFRKPIFGGEKIVAGAASNNVLFLGTDTGRLLRWETEGDEIEEIKLARPPKDLPRHIFVDYETRDFIVAFGTADNYYVKETPRNLLGGRRSLGTSSFDRPRALGRIRGVALTSVYFVSSEMTKCFGNTGESKNQTPEGTDKLSSSSSNQRLVLLGSENGVVLGLFVDSATGKDESVFKLWNVPGGEAVYSIRAEIVANSRQEKIYAFVVIICTITRLYQFIGDANFEIFEKNPHVFEVSTPESEMLGRSKSSSSSTTSMSPTSLKTLKPITISQKVSYYTEQNGFRARKFSWITHAGIIHGEFDWTRLIRNTATSSVISNKALIRIDGTNNTRPSNLIASSLTEFYIVLLYADRVVLVNQLSGKVYQELNISFVSSLRSSPPQVGTIATTSQMTKNNIVASDMLHDVVNNSLWIYSSNGYFLRLFHEREEEEEGMWRVAMSVHRFDLAFQLCSTSEQAQTIFLAQADWLADTNGAYREAAKLYAKTKKPMEEVLLKLLEAPHPASEPSPEMEYLLALLDHTSEDCAMQRMIISTLIVEQYCKQSFVSLVKKDDSGGTLLADLDLFLRDHWRDLDLKTSLSVLLSHGLWNAAVTLALCAKRWQDALQICIQNQAFDKALDILKQSEGTEMFVRFAGILSLHIPEKLASTAIEAGREAATKVVIATVRTYRFTKDSLVARRAFTASMKLLESIFDDLYFSKMILHLYASDCDEEAAFQAFQSMLELVKKEDKLDLSVFAMRCCIFGNFAKGCVEVFCSLGMFYEAVEIACHIDPIYAKEIVTKLTRTSSDDSIARKLWLRVAVGIAGSDPSSLVAVVEDSNGILKIEDVIPHMNEFTQLDDKLKEAIGSSLVYNQQRIQNAINMTKQVEELTERLIGEMKDLKKMENKHVCTANGDVIWSFPCGHSFDKEGLCEAWSDIKRDDIIQWKVFVEQDDATLKLLERECPLCGEDIVDTIDRIIHLD